MELTTRADGKCLVCGTRLYERPTVWCDDCQTPTHQDCFAFTGKCAVYGCRGLRYTHSPGGRGVQWVEIAEPGPESRATSFVVDFTSWRENLANVTILTGLAIGFFACSGGEDYSGPFPAHPRVLGVALVVSVLAAIIRFSLNDYRVVHGPDRTIWMHWRFFGWSSVSPVATFDQCREVILSYQQYSDDGTDYRKWVVQIRLADGSRIAMTDEDKQRIANETEALVPPESLATTADRLANLIGVSRVMQPQ